MKVSSVMSAHPVTIPASATLDRAQRLMDANDVRHLPVLEDGILRGILSDRDLLEVMRRPGGGTGSELDKLEMVRAHMRVPVETVSPNQDVAVAAAKLARWRVGCLPVVDRAGLIGMLTDIDVMRALERRAREGSLQPGEDPLLSSVAARDAAHVGPNATLAEARELMRFQRVRHVPIAAHGEVFGVLSDRDVRRAVGRGLPDATPVRALVPSDVIWLAPEARLSQAAELMVLHRIGAIVLLERHLFAGIVTSTDVLEHCATLDWRSRGPARTF